MDHSFLGDPTIVEEWEGGIRTQDLSVESPLEPSPPRPRILGTSIREKLCRPTSFRNLGPKKVRERMRTFQRINLF